MNPQWCTVGDTKFCYVLHKVKDYDHLCKIIWKLMKSKKPDKTQEYYFLVQDGEMSWYAHISPNNLYIPQTAHVVAWYFQNLPNISQTIDPKKIVPNSINRLFKITKPLFLASVP